MPPPEGPATIYLSEDVCRIIAADIAEAGHVEVFFVGRRDATGLVVEVESRAYGREDRVPAITQSARPGDVVIHNHPSGELGPSEADINLSSAIGQMGIGSYIVSNDCARCRVVVKPSDPDRRLPLDEREVLAVFQSGSTLASAVGEYEDRPQQRDMAAAVVRAINGDSIAVIEAGTGTGKSLAYLVPAVMHALRNKERIVVSTNTINLQEQLLNKDIPAVRSALGQDFAVELVKGRSNYVCKRKAQFAAEELNALVEPEHRDELREVLSWAKSSQTGDRGELAVTPRPEVWERVESEADNCLRVRCPFYAECFYYNSRRRAARADVLIVNHSLLLSDLSVRQESNNWSMAAVLPPYRRIVVDEAHHLEEVATRHLAREVSRPGLRRTFARLYRTDGRHRAGALAAASEEAARLVERRKLDMMFEPYLKLITELCPSVATVRERCDRLMDDFGHRFLELTDTRPPRGSMELRLRLLPELTAAPEWQEAEETLRRLCEDITAFLGANREVLAGFRECGEDVLGPMTNSIMEWGALLGRLDERRRIILRFLEDDPSQCRWVELAADQQGRLVVRLDVAPIDVGNLIREAMHERMASETLASATLTVASSFEFFLRRTGLSPGPSPCDGDESPQDAEPAPGTLAGRIESVRLSSPFRYDRQVFIGIPNDLGDARTREFEGRLPDFINRAVAASDGRALVLFTSHAQLRACHEACAPVIRRLGYECLRQGTESRDRLLAKFREDETSVLFATSSFWEGIDVRGRALELVILARLPFAQPDEPIQQAQVEWLKSQGRDPFDELIVPRAIIRFRQGFGRLIRSATDRGAVLVADDRVMRMRYGRRFLDSLPPCDVRMRPSLRLIEEMRAFYGGVGGG